MSATKSIRVDLEPDEAALVRQALVYMQARTAYDSTYREREDGSAFTDTEFFALLAKLT